MAKLSFHQGPGRYDQVVKLDGEDISKAIRSLSINAEAGQIPEVELQLAVFEIEVGGPPELGMAETKIRIFDETVELLKRLGWTPPVNGQEN